MKQANLKTFKLSIIIPIFNEENTIIQILDKIEKQNYIKKQIILIDDYSSDETLSLIQNYKFKSEFKIIKHKKNKGKGSCVISAKDYIDGDFVIIQDADLEYNPKDYLKMLTMFINENLKCLYGSRVMGKNRYIQKNFTSNFRIFANHVLTIITNLLYRQRLTDAHTCYKLFDVKLFKSINLKEKRFAFCPEISAKVAKKKIFIKECQIQYNGRSIKEGKKIKFIDGIAALWALLKYKFYE